MHFYSVPILPSFTQSTHAMHKWWTGAWNQTSSGSNNIKTTSAVYFTQWCLILSKQFAKGSILHQCWGRAFNINCSHSESSITFYIYQSFSIFSPFSFFLFVCLGLFRFVSLTAHFYQESRRAKMSSNTQSFIQESLGTQTQLLPFGLHLPKTADRHKTIVCSKAVLRNWQLTQEHIHLQNSICVTVNG